MLRFQTEITIILCALTFTGLNFRGFHGSIAIDSMKVSSRENLDQTGKAYVIMSQTTKIKMQKPRKLAIRKSLTPRKLKRIRYSGLLVCQQIKGKVHTHISAGAQVTDVGMGNCTN